MSYPTWDKAKLSYADLLAKFNSDWSGNSINISGNPTTSSISTGTPITEGYNSSGDNTNGNTEGNTNSNSGGTTDPTSGEGNIGGNTTPSDKPIGNSDSLISTTPEDALIKYNGIITSIQKDSGVRICFHKRLSKV